MLVVLEAMLRAFDVFDEVVHVQLVVEGSGHRPSSVPVGGMENDGGSHGSKDCARSMMSDNSDGVSVTFVITER